jgi:RHS repeat-associated protein
MTYDFNGNLTQISEGGQNTDLTWDVRDRLTNMTGPGLTASFAYDASARRTQKTINAFTTTFQYDGLDIMREVAGGSAVNYLRSRVIDEPLARIEESGSTTCYAPDALGSTLALTDSTGNVATEYTYEPFGRTVATGAQSLNPFQFTARESDGSGLYYYRARYYSPGNARFVQNDPIGLRGGINSYGYADGNPVRSRDPLGLFIPGVHYGITEEAMRAEGYGPRFIDRVSLWTSAVDLCSGSQSPENAHWHAMCSPGTHPDVGFFKTEKYIDDNIKKCTIAGLARALHAAQDSQSASHRGCQVWPGGFPSWDHVKPDAIPSSQELGEAVRRSRDVIRQFRDPCKCGPWPSGTLC